MTSEGYGGKKFTCDVVSLNENKVGEKDCSIGMVIKAARNHNNISLSQVTNSLKISTNFLIAIEADDYSNLPSPVIARGFIKSYAKFLGVEGLVNHNLPSLFSENTLISNQALIDSNSSFLKKPLAKKTLIFIFLSFFLILILKTKAFLKLDPLAEKESATPFKIYNSLVISSAPLFINNENKQISFSDSKFSLKKTEDFNFNK